MVNDRHSQLVWFLPHLVIGIGIIGFGSAWLAMFGFHLVLLGIILTRKQEFPILLKGWSWKWGLALILMTAPSGAFVYAFYTFLPFEFDAVRLAVFGVLGKKWIWFCVYFCTVNPALEELFWRGQTSNKGSIGINMSDVGFGTYHLVVLIFFLPPPIAVGVTLILCFVGWLWRLAASKLGGLATSLVSHTVADLSVLLGVSALIR